MRRAENKEFWKLRSMENVEYGKCECGNQLSAFHLNKNYENSGSGSKGKRFSVCPTGKSGAAQKVIPFFPVGKSRLAFHVPIAIEFYCKMSQYSFYSLQQSYHLVLHCASLLRTILA